MGKLTLDEKITLNELPKLVLEEDYESAVKTLVHYPEINNLINNEEWGDAFEAAERNGHEQQRVLVDNGKPLDQQQKSLITRIASDNGLEAKFANDSMFYMDAKDSSSVQNIPYVMNYLHGLDYSNGKRKKVTPILDNDSLDEYGNDDPVTLKNSIVDMFLEKTGSNKALTDSGEEIFKTICNNGGMQRNENPFLDFLESVSTRDRFRKKLTGEHMAALNNLYVNGIISYDDIAYRDKGNILNHPSLYENNPRANDLIELVTNYNKSTDEKKQDYFDNGRVRPWNEIKKNIKVVNQRKNDILRLNKNSSQEDTDDFVRRVPERVRRNLERSLQKSRNNK